jgi:D-alanyl-D-alanine carboxypeptidase/D-alanyl-D-alanine-endopeptidase (penicillin-binding protein 4)
MKLFTTGVALRQLGPAHVWRTEAGLGGPLQANGTLDGPLYLRGSGDPSLLIEHVQRMMARWRGAGLRDIRGGIVVDRSLFELPTHDPNAFDGQSLRPYNAGPDALLLNHQSVTLRLMPDAARAGQALASIEPPLSGVQLVQRLNLVPGACGDWRGALKLDIARQAVAPADGRARWTVQLSGPYPAACGEKEWPLLWVGDGQGDHAARLLEATWLASGGQWGSQAGNAVRDGAWPAGLPAWQTWVSPPLASVVRDINKFSNNVMARQLFLSLAVGANGASGNGATAGDGRGAPATLAQARAAVARQVIEATGGAASACRDEALVLDNGSGLSRQEHASARCMAQWLQSMWRSPVMPEFIASLPLNGVDGTTRRWQAAAGLAHIKTGSLDGVVSVSGYVLGESGQRIVVVGWSTTRAPMPPARCCRPWSNGLARIAEPRAGAQPAKPRQPILTSSPTRRPHAPCEPPARVAAPDARRHRMDRRHRRRADHGVLHAPGLADLSHPRRQRHLAGHVQLLHHRGGAVAGLWPVDRLGAGDGGQRDHAELRLGDPGHEDQVRAEQAPLTPAPWRSRGQNCS